MKKFLFAMILLIPALAWAKSNPGDYTIVVHVQSSQMTSLCNDTLGHPYCWMRDRLAVLIDGKKYTLDSKDLPDALLRTGDYKARIVADDTSISLAAYDTSCVYEFLFPDGKTRKYILVGESE
jgi:hypothetical protein